MRETRAANYWEYIRVEELLSLQGGLGDDDAELTNAEVLFVTVHQVYELWFKVILRELGALRDLFHGEHVADQELAGAVAGIDRIATILRMCVGHFEVVETLQTRDYLEFRDKLMPASGFQSAQLRQIEILVGLDDAERIPLGLDESYMEALRAHDGSDSPALARVRRQHADMPSVREAIDEWLYRTPIDGVSPGDEGADDELDRFVADYCRAHAGELDHTCAMALERTRGDEDRARLRARYEEEKAALAAFLDPPEEEGGRRRRRVRAAMLFISSYRELPLLSWPRQLLDGLIQLEQGLTLFRQRHARMVERVIGRRTGTGGSAGVDYLDQTALRYRVFRDLWAVRTMQVRRGAAPELANAAFYGFRNG